MCYRVSQRHYFSVPSSVCLQKIMSCTLPREQTQGRVMWAPSEVTTLCPQSVLSEGTLPGTLDSVCSQKAAGTGRAREGQPCPGSVQAWELPHTLSVAWKGGRSFVKTRISGAATSGSADVNAALKQQGAECHLGRASPSRHPSFSR